MTQLTTSPGTTVVLHVAGLTKSYGAKTILDGFDLELRSGEVVSLLGANGSGKSTALRCIAGLNRPDAGDIAVDGVAARPGRPVPTVAMVFQKIHIVPRRSVLDNVCTGALGRLSFTQSFSPLAFPRQVREEAMTCLDRVGLADRPHEHAGRLSGGQQQRVAIARSLCQRARVLLADEPVSALDPAAAEQVMRLLRSLAEDDGIAVAAVLHQPDLARRYSDRIVGLMHGRISVNATPDEITDETVEALYRPDLEAEL